MDYFFLLLAILFEVTGTIMLKFSNGFSVLFPSVGAITTYIGSFYFLSLALRSIEIGVAYALWSALGISIITVVGILYFNESTNPIKIISLLCVIIGVIGLYLTENHA